MPSTTVAPATTKPVHILVFPYPAYGHMLAILDLSHQLALQGLKITILVTPKNVDVLNPLISAHPNSIQTLVLPFPPHPKLPLGVENVKDVGNSGNGPIIASLSKLEGQVIQWFQSHPCPPQAVISDFFLGCTQHWAEQLNVPRFAFFSVRVFLFGVLNHLFLNIDSVCSSEVVEFPDMPKSPSFAAEHLPSIVKKYRKGDPDWEIVKDGMLANSKSWGFIFNSFYSLEGEYLDHLKEKLGHGKVYSVGPLKSIGRSKSPMDSESRSNVLSWLDKCPDGSVLYACFGSQKPLTSAQLKALALGLERSRTRFVWVVKSAADQQEWDPVQFQKQVADRALVLTGWAPQVEIMNHKAVGGFLSHCGWNSLIESLLAGLMILAWPMEADHHINARLLVEDMEMVVWLCDGEHTVPDPDEVAKTISKSFSGNIPQKERVKVMRDKALEAVKAGGSSSRDLNELLKELRQIGVLST